MESVLRIVSGRVLIVLWFVLLLSGCGTGAVHDPASRYYRIPVGTQIKLHQPLSVPGGRTRLFLQRGVVLGGGLDQYHPSCNFELYTLSEQVRVIEPDVFMVVRVQRGFEEVVSLGGIKLATVGYYPFDWFDAPMVSRFYHFYLGSDRQPDVLRLTCHGAFDEMPRADLPTLAEIHEALGAVATIHLPGGKDAPMPGVIEDK